MRISGDGYLSDMQRGLMTAESALRRLSQQISSGRRLTRPSDDPLAVGQVIAARADLAAVLNRQDALTRGVMLTGSADSALDEISAALRNALDLVVGAGQPGGTEASRAATAAGVRSLRERILDQANVRVQGDYLFGGRLSRAQPFADGPAGVTYAGDSQGLELWVAPGRPMEVTIPGDRLFNFADASGVHAVAGVDSDLFALLDTIADAIEAGDADAVAVGAGDLQRLYDHVIQQRGVLGARTQRLQDGQDAAAQAELVCRDLLSRVDDVDLAEALAELELRRLNYQAALAATARLAALPTLFELDW